MNPDLPPHFRRSVRDALGASSIEVLESLQELWSGYGQILRLRLHGLPEGTPSTAIAKHVRFPTEAKHPRGWTSSRSHERKLKSYAVERAWYRDWASRCDERCRVARPLMEDEEGGEVLILLEDLDSAGFPARATSPNPEQIEACLRWLAHFHATFIGARPDGLWETGTYWQLGTRPDELDALEDLLLKKAAPKLDEALSGARFQTLVHGDAKVANFCFSATPGAPVGMGAPVAMGAPAGTGAPAGVAAVDFQYVGGGCGMKDVAYFLGSCLDEAALEAQVGAFLDVYFAALRSSLADKQPGLDAATVEREWRPLFPVAWTDFHRFLKGWAPGHWKINSYSERLARAVLSTL